MKAGLVYAKRFGWRVVPLHSVHEGRCSCGKPDCRSAGKHPRVADWVKAASNDPGVIAGWPDLNVGVATGQASGFFALDVDPGNGGDETLAELERTHGSLPVTACARTGSGGTHYLFRNPDFAVTNSAGKVGRGLDVRGDGGQIVVAPSVSAKGAYIWIKPPWSTPLAEAPTWLLDALRTRAVPEAQPQAERGYFPPASAAVLEDAADALRFHGPAIEGKGGDLHTYRAAAILTHDFALTDEEAWPLLEEWNETCQPPWSEPELRAKLHGGDKYGTAAYGCKRSFDSAETAKKWLRDWEQGERTEASMYELAQRVRGLPFADPLKRGVVERDYCAALGIKPKELALPPARADLEQPSSEEIMVTPKLHEVADAAIKRMKDHVFQRNGVLCEVVSTGDRTFISDLEPKRILDLMSRTATYVRQDEKGLTTQAPPDSIAGILHARRTHPVRVLEAVTTAPVFLADGTILQERGYNEQARVFLEPSVEVNVPEEPTRADARRALAQITDLLGDFHFASPADLSSWVAGLLSPLVKAATKNAPSPLFCVSASSPGAGKTLLVDVAARIVTGLPVENRTYNPRDPTEWVKKLTTFVRMATPISVFDNANGAVGDEGLDRLITASTWSDRILGASEAPPLPNVTTWFATGNNIEPVGDTVRRVLMIRIEVDTEKPQERTGFKRPLLVEYAEQHRSELLGAALTVLRAYHLAGRPDQQLPAWGSFTAWSALVRGALVWAGMADPFLTQQRAAADLNEPENEAHDFWIGIVAESDGLPASIVALANQCNAQEILGMREPMTAAYLRRFVGRFVDKPRHGQRIRRDGGSYYVEEIL